MTDWLNELEEKRKREDRRRQEEEAEADRVRKVADARHAADYDRHKKAVDLVLKDIIATIERANNVLTTKLQWERGFESELIVTNGPAYTLSRFKWHPNSYRYMQIGFFDRCITIYSEWPDPNSYPQPMPHSNYFKIPVQSVSKELISSWVKWLATGEAQ